MGRESNKECGGSGAKRRKKERKVESVEINCFNCPSGAPKAGNCLFFLRFIDVYCLFNASFCFICRSSILSFITSTARETKFSVPEEIDKKYELRFKCYVRTGTRSEEKEQLVKETKSTNIIHPFLLAADVIFRTDKAC